MITTRSFALGLLLLVPVSLRAASGQEDAGPCRAPGPQCESQRECRRGAGDAGGEQAYRTCLALRDKESDDCAAERDRYEQCTTSAGSAGTRPADSAAGGRRGEAGHDAGDVTGADDGARGRGPERDR